MAVRDVVSARILIADEHPIFRDGLKRLLETEPGLRVVGEAGDGLPRCRWYGSSSLICCCST